ncbi:MAG: spermidine/putrescine ABC transporter substrate-binding protein [Oscillospiraceae bacterium]|nr:spermidine/putrescine ABC transporter substrate-binding protein [Oscillospiraceae bacterium]
MKRIIPVLLCLVLLFSALPVQAFAAPEKVTINVYNWGQYISDGTDGYIDVNKAFTEATGIEVNYMTFDSNETMYTKLKTGGSTYDVIIPSDYMVARLIAEDMLEELDYSNIPNYALVDEAYKNTSFDPENKYSVPYTWGTVGVIYNTKYVDEADVGSWDLLWNEKYSGKILMFDNPRDAFAIAQFLLGIDINTEDPDELRSAAYKLIEQKPLVQGYVMDQIFSKMEREEAWIAPYYGGDYLLMAEENPDLAFYFPEEGFNLFIDAMCIPKGCQNKEAAEAYINFLCDPEISGENLDYLGYSTPVSEAKEYMDPDVAASPIAYPTEETLANGSAFINLSAETSQLTDSLWLQVKTQGGVDTYAIVCMCAVVVLLTAYFIIHGARKKKRIANRCKKWKT